jgi:hypothetical protein
VPYEATRGGAAVRYGDHGLPHPTHVELHDMATTIPRDDPPLRPAVNVAGAAVLLAAERVQFVREHLAVRQTVPAMVGVAHCRVALATDRGALDARMHVVGGEHYVRWLVVAARGVLVTHEPA